MIINVMQIGKLLDLTKFNLAAGEKMIFSVYKLKWEIAKTCNVPKEMKHSILIMIYKKGCKSNPMNYRPISLL